MDNINRKATSLWILSGTNPFRRLCIHVVRHRIFSGIVLVSIILNSITLAIDSGDTNPPWVEELLDVSELVFTVVFSIEMCFKILAHGFLLHRHAYLRSKWNCLDFAIVIIGIVSLIANVQNLSTLRLFRVLRPLRSINNVPQLQQLVTCLFHSIPMVVDNVMLMCFLILIFAIAGVQLFAGDMSHRCYVMSYGNDTLFRGMPTPILYSEDTRLCGGTHSCELSPWAINYSFDVQCDMKEDLYYAKHLNYDYVWSSLLLVFKIMSLDNWTEDLENAMNSSSWSAFLYFVLLTVLGGYFCINLFLAILTKEYTDTVKRMEAERLKEEREKEEAVDNPLDVPPIDGEDAHTVSSAGSAAEREMEMKAVEEDAASEEKEEEAHRQAIIESIFTKANSLAAEGFLHDRVKVRSADRSPKGSLVPDDAADDAELKFGEFRASGAFEAPPNNDEYMYPDMDPEPAVPVEEQEPQEMAAIPVTDDNDSAKLDVKAPHPRKQRPSVLVWHSPIQPAVADTDDKAIGPALFSDRTSFSEIPVAEENGEMGDSAVEEAEEESRLEAIEIMAASRSAIMLEAVEVFDPLVLEADAEGGSGFRYQVRMVLGRRGFERTILGLTLLSVICLSIDHYKIPPELDAALDMSNIVFTLIFALEIVAKVVGFGFACFKDSFTVADAIIVLAGIPDIFFSSGTGLNAFRAFRLIRVLRLARRWPSLQLLLRMLMASMSAAAYLSILVMLFIYIFAILGMQLFGNQFPDGVRTRFSSIWEAGLTCFIIITGDSWTSVMKLGMDVSAPVGSIYFLALYAIGNYILLNLFVAIILDTLDDQTRQQEEQIRQEDEALKEQQALEAENNVSADDLKTPMSPTSPVKKSSDLKKSPLAPPKSPSPYPKSPHSPTPELKRTKNLKGRGNSFDAGEMGFSTRWDAVRSLVSGVAGTADFIPRGKSLNLFDRKNVVRVFCVAFIQNKRIEAVILVITFGNCIMVGIENNVSTEDKFILDLVSAIVTGVFVLEACIKIVALGAWTKCYRDHVPYFRDTFNLVDFVVTLIGVLGLHIDFFQMFLVLRLVRVAMRFENLRVVIVALVKALPHVIKGMCLCLFVFLIFGILGVQLFKGEFYHCSDKSILYSQDCVGTYVIATTYEHTNITMPAVNLTRVWTQETENFDDIINAMFTLFIIVVSDGWAVIMFRGMDTVDVEIGPVTNASPAVSLYFIAFIILGNFFTLNIILGLLINYFTQLKKESEGYALLTKNQRDYLQCKKLIDAGMFKSVPVVPTNPFLHLCFRIVFGSQALEHTHEDPGDNISLFEKFITLAILLNAVTLSIHRIDMSPEETNALSVVNIIFTAIFAIEAGLKLCALGRVYFEDSWNRFDFLVVLATIVGLFVGIGSGASVVRLLRVGRLLRLIRRAEGLNKLFNTMSQALPAVMNVVILLLGTFYMFAVIGVNLFGNVVNTPPLTDNTNFKNVVSAMLLLYGCATTEGWSDVMGALMVREPDCSQAAGNCGVDEWGVKLYFVLFMLCGSFVMIQLLIAIVVDTFTDVDGDGKHVQIIKAFASMKTSWAECFGPHTTRIPCALFFDYMKTIPRELTGLPRHPSNSQILCVLNSCMVPVTRDMNVQYRDVVYGFAFHVFEIDHDKASILAKFDGPKVREGVFTVAHVYATRLLGKIWKNKIKRSQEERETSKAT